MDAGLLSSTIFRREVLVSLFLIGIVISGFGAVTLAYYQDTGQSDTNTIQAGALDLTVDGSHDVSNSFAITGGVPGDSDTHTYDLRNVGSVTADHVEVSVSFSENDNGVSEPSDSSLSYEQNATETASSVDVTRLEYQDDTGTTLQDLLTNVTDDNNNGITDLEDVQNNQGAFDDLTPPQANSGNTTKLAITVEIANDDGSFTGSDEDMMGDGIDVTVTVTLNQDSQQ